MGAEEGTTLDYTNLDDSMTWRSKGVIILHGRDYELVMRLALQPPLSTIGACDI